MILEQFSAGIVPASSSANGSVVAWLSFNGTGVPAITASSSNVISITDNGVGDYTINFSPNLTDANYAVLGSGSGDSYKDIIALKSTVQSGAATTKTSAACRIICGRTEGNTADGAVISVIFVR